MFNTNMFSGKVIAITGGTGSFGKAFTRNLLAHHNPRKVVIISRDELKQYEMAQEFNDSRLRFLIADVRDAERIMFALRGIDFVIHAAALKQVPAAEYNPQECVKTNIVGANNVISAALANNVDKVIALSTDKASSPINLYGATKLVSDKLFTAANNMRGDCRTLFAVVRYGNVACSRGSVIPFFEKLVASGEQTLPITHLDMTRFLITLEQGVELVFKTFPRMHGGEIFVPKLPSVKIVDLAAVMLPKKRPEIIGIRPGEKLHEEMIPVELACDTIEFDDFFTIKPSIRFFGSDIDYRISGLGEKGELVDPGFCYQSGTNPYFLSRQEISKLLGGLGTAA